MYKGPRAHGARELAAGVGELLGLVVLDPFDDASAMKVVVAVRRAHYVFNEGLETDGAPWILESGEVVIRSVDERGLGLSDE